MPALKFVAFPRVGFCVWRSDYSIMTDVTFTQRRFCPLSTLERPCTLEHTEPIFSPQLPKSCIFVSSPFVLGCCQEKMLDLSFIWKLVTTHVPPLKVVYCSPFPRLAALVLTRTPGTPKHWLGCINFLFLSHTKLQRRK